MRVTACILEVGDQGFHTSDIKVSFINVTGLFLANENRIGPAIGLLSLVLREASRDQ